jgi:FAD binding domain
MPRDVPSLSPAAVRALESTLRSRLAGDVDFSAGARALYAADASNYRQLPIGVVLPKTPDDVLETVRTCHELHVAILPRGAGTSLAGQGCNAAVVMDMSRHLRRLVAIDPDRRTARVQPGVVLRDSSTPAKSSTHTRRRSTFVAPVIARPRLARSSTSLTKAALEEPHCVVSASASAARRAKARCACCFPRLRRGCGHHRHR